MEKIYKFFLENFVGLAGFWGDSSILGSIPRSQFADVAGKLGYAFFENDGTFVLSKFKYC